MQLQNTEVKAADGLSIPVRLWRPAPRSETPPAAPRAVLQISHGMSEHGGRYEPLASRLAAAGVATVASDHRGHGLWVGRRGHYANADGWSKVTLDLLAVRQYIASLYPGVPVFFLGHSMGSFIGLCLLQRHHPDYRGVALSGSDYSPSLKFRLALPLARAERWCFGAGGRSPLMTFISFGSFNRGFQPQRTSYDWLSRDADQVDRYIHDPLCGFDCSNQLWVDLLEGMAETFSPDHMASLADLPYYLFAGDRDPVGRQGHGVRALEKALRRAGITRIVNRLYPDGRHEMLNESNREEVQSDLLNWLEGQLKG